MGDGKKGDHRLMRKSITLRVRAETPQKLQKLAERLHLLCQRSGKVGKPSISRLLDFLADNAEKVFIE